MTQSNLLQLAQAGDADAIAALMNASLQAIGVSARAVLQNGDLHVLLESERILAPSPSIEFIRRGLTRLGLAWISSAVVYGRLVGQNTPVWVQQVQFSAATLTNPFVLDPGIQLQAAGEEDLAPQWWSNLSPLTLALLLSVPIVFLLSSSIIWVRYLSVGSPAELTRASEQSAKSSVVKQGQAESAKADPVSNAMSFGKQAYLLGKAASSKEDWRKAAEQWRKAIAILQAVPNSHPRAAIAQEKLVEYQGHLDFVLRDRVGSAGMELVKTITGSISPKSIVHSGKGLFFAQNMMYSHSVTVYDRQYNLVKTIPDEIKLSDYGYSQYSGTQHGAPVEADFSPDGQTAWVSNYQMYGAGFSSSADDDCSPEQNHDQSFLYRISTQNLNIEKAVQVGAVPKYVAATPNNRYVLVSNWCSWDVSVIDTQTNREVRRIQLGPYPRGIVVDKKSATAYVAVMGSYDIAAINLNDFSVDWLRDIGHSPRHLNIDPAGKYLYATLNGEGQVAKVDLASKTVVSKAATGSAPRSMAIAADGQFLYIVNYDSDTVSKVSTATMQVVQTVAVNSAPIGITYDAETNQVWVACYSGSIQVFQD